MKTRFVVVAIFIIFKVSRAKEENKFDCPVDCPPNVYKPVCSRGISYANLCVLKQEICKGKTAREIYDDVEACPSYEKNDDASGKSVEAIDENGVIFRRFIDTPKKSIHATTDVTREESSSTVREKESDTSQKKDRKDKSTEQNRPPCSCDGNNLSNICPPQFCPCNSCWPSIPILVVGNNVEIKNEFKPSKDEITVDNNFLSRLLGILPVATEKTRRAKLQDADVNPLRLSRKTIPSKPTEKCRRDKSKRKTTKSPKSTPSSSTSTSFQSTSTSSSNSTPSSSSNLTASFSNSTSSS